jgi:glycerol uptake facilitator protein
MATERVAERERPRAAEGEAPTGAAPLGRRLASEFLGTLLLVAVGTGAATVVQLGPAQAFNELAEQEALSGAPQERAVFEGLLGNSLGDLLPVAFAFAIILAILVYSLGGVSGAHFNPAVTLALAAVRRFSWKELPLYWIVQCAGAIAGAFVIAGIYGSDGALFSSTVDTIDPATGQPSGSSSIETPILFGATVVADNIDVWQAILAEAFITFILVLAIMAVAVDPRAPKGWSGLVIGLALGAGVLVASNATGGSANFARSLGPFVASLPYDVGDIPWGDLLIYASGPLIGAVAAAFVYESVSGLERFAPAPRPGAATTEPADVEDDDAVFSPEAGTRRSSTDT